MLAYLKRQTRMIATATLACTPWLFAMYLLYWIDKNAIWNAETPFRDPMSAAVVAAGMLLSLLLYSRLNSRSSN